MDLEEKKIDEAKKSFHVFMTEMAKAGQKGIFHKNKVSRKVSQIAQKLHNLQK